MSKRRLCPAHSPFYADTCPQCAREIAAAYPAPKQDATQTPQQSTHAVRCWPIAYGPRDWPEDDYLENGNYQCACRVCNEFFFGYKRRSVCKVCAFNKP